MKKVMVLCLTTLIFSGAVGAAGMDSTMKAVLNSWVGQNINTVIDKWGYPSEEKTIAGRKLYYWRQDGTFYAPTETSGTVNTYGNTSYINALSYGGAQSVSCTRILEVDSEEVVKTGQWQGNNCPITKTLKYRSWVNPTTLQEEDDKLMRKVKFQKNDAN